MNRYKEDINSRNSKLLCQDFCEKWDKFFPDYTFQDLVRKISSSSIKDVRKMSSIEFMQELSVQCSNPLYGWFRVDYLSDENKSREKLFTLFRRSINNYIYDYLGIIRKSEDTWAVYFHTIDVRNYSIKDIEEMGLNGTDIFADGFINGLMKIADAAIEKRSLDDMEFIKVCSSYEECMEFIYKFIKDKSNDNRIERDF